MKTFSSSLTYKMAVSSLVLASCVCADVNSALAAPTVTTKTTTTKSSTSAFNIDEPWSVLKTPKVIEAMKTAMGSSYPQFKESTQQLESFTVKGDELFSHGGVAGLYTEMESAISFNQKNNRAQVAILDDGKLKIWGASANGELTASMSAFIADLKSRRQNLAWKVVFQSPGKPTTKTSSTKSKTVVRNITTASPTGTYSRDSQWDGATLKVLKLNGNKLKFEISAAHGANTGGADGEIALVNNKATYTGEGYKLTFDYQGKSIGVDESGDGFGGMGVTATGTYKKTDDKTPTFDDLN